MCFNNEFYRLEVMFVKFSILAIFSDEFKKQDVDTVHCSGQQSPRVAILITILLNTKQMTNPNMTYIMLNYI